MKGNISRLSSDTPDTLVTSNDRFFVRTAFPSTRRQTETAPMPIDRS